MAKFASSLSRKVTNANPIQAPFSFFFLVSGEGVSEIVSVASLLLGNALVGSVSGGEHGFNGAGE